MIEDTIGDLIEARFASLSPQLRQAARFVIDNPEEIALSSMRAAAAKAHVHPSSMLRLARELGFKSYDPFRKQFRNWIVMRGEADWSGRAQTLRQGRPASANASLITDMVRQEQVSLQKTFGPEIMEKLVSAERLISEARNVYILGLRSLFPVAFFMHYVCQMFMAKTVLMTGFGGTFADDLRNIDDKDVMVAFSYRPYAQDAVQAVTFARERRAQVVAVTDSKVSPIIGDDGVSIVVSNKSRSLLPTILPAVAVAQALASLLVAESGDETMAKIAKSEAQLNRFGVYIK